MAVYPRGAVVRVAPHPPAVVRAAVSPVGRVRAASVGVAGGGRRRGVPAAVRLGRVARPAVVRVPPRRPGVFVVGGTVVVVVPPGRSVRRTVPVPAVGSGAVGPEAGTPVLLVAVRHAEVA